MPFLMSAHRSMLSIAMRSLAFCTLALFGVLGAATAARACPDGDGHAMLSGPQAIEPGDELRNRMRIPATRDGQAVLRDDIDLTTPTQALADAPDPMPTGSLRR